MSSLKGKVKLKDRRRKLIVRAKKVVEYKKRQIQKIRTFDDSILKEKCELVLDVLSVKNIIDDMSRVLAATENGVGLAASQIGFAQQIIAIRPNVSKGTITIMINPEIIDHSEKKVFGKEGCLSFPGIIIPIARYISVIVKFEDEKSNVKTKEYFGFEAIVIQHEINHILGKCSLYDVWKKQNDAKNE